MEPQRMPSEAEIRAAYPKGEDAVVKLLLEIKTAVEEAPPEQQSLPPNQLTDFETHYVAILKAESANMYGIGTGRTPT